MTHKYTGGLGKSFAGDRDKAVSYMGRARLLVQQLVNRVNAAPFNGSGQQYGSMRMADGSVIHAMVQMVGLHPIIRTWIESPSSAGESLVTQPNLIQLTGGFIVAPHDDDAAADDVFIALYGYGTGSRIYRSTTKLDRVTYEAHTGKVAGPVSWYGSYTDVDGKIKDAVISWDHGIESRYRLSLDKWKECSGRVVGYDIADGTPYITNYGKKGIYLDGVKIDTPQEVVGAAALGEYLLFIAHHDPEFVWNDVLTYWENREAQAKADCKCATLFARKLSQAEWTTVFTVRLDSEVSPWILSFRSPWFFSPDGTKASTYTTIADTGETVVYTINTSVVDGELTATLETENRLYKKAAGNPGPCVPSPIETYEPSSAGPDGAFSIWEVGDSIVTFGPSDSGLYGKMTTVASAAGEVEAFFTQQIVDYYEQYPGGHCELNSAELSRITADIALQAGVPNDVRAPYPYELLPVTYYNKDTGDYRYSGNRYPIASSNQMLVGTWTSWGNFIAYIDRNFHVRQKWYNREFNADSDYRGSRLIAVDYDFNGNKLYVEQVLEFPEGDLGRGQSFITSDRSQDEVVHEVTGGGNRVTSTSTLKQTRSWELAMRWALKVNDDTIITACAGFTSNFDGNGNIIANEKYYREMNNTTVYYPDGGYSWQTVTTEQPPTTPQIITERVWIQDLDARSKSAIYSKARITSNITVLPETTFDSDNEDYRNYALGSSRRLDVDAGAYTCAAHVVHYGSVIDSVSVDAGMPSHWGRLWEQLPAFMILPRMSSIDDDFEADLPPWQLVCDTDTIVESFWGSVSECYAPVRYPGQLAVRDPANMMYSYSSESVLSHGSLPCHEDPREPVWFNGAVFFDTSYSAVSPQLINLVKEEAILTPDQFRFHPIRAV